eukprot:TRINITY_DN95149_c0_g1_i1.p1 TRINITY_DN95149_c0_g1~~TRINITY_DN95149_c0_g1_i1.p1  ORF type:complete len:348 (-),score=49.65 TRINITY_DN95149_c0_g1_i1:40-1083(-)
MAEELGLLHSASAQPMAELRCTSRGGFAAGVAAGVSLSAVALLVGLSSLQTTAPSPAASQRGLGSVSLSATLPLPGAVVATVQHIYIVRHGDKYSSYPPCAEYHQTGGLCYNEKLMGNNPPLTPCGIDQATYTAKWLLNQSHGGIANIVASPFTRALQTSLPLAKALGKTLHVEHLVSEDRQEDGPFKAFNADAPGETVHQLEEIEEAWERGYGSPPIETPENDVRYLTRVQRATQVLKDRFPPSSGNLAVFAHATTAFSIAYGLCYGATGTDKTLKDFVDGHNAIAPGGVLHVILDADGSCKTVEQTINVADSVACGKTEPFKRDFDSCPAFYWNVADADLKGRCD